MKHVDLYSKNKFEKLVHLAGFIIRIYHDARSSECQIREKQRLWFPYAIVCEYSGSQRGSAERGFCPGSI